MIDTHCHLDVSRFDEDRDQVLERAWAAGLTGIVVPAIGPDSWEPLLSLPARDPRLQVGLGIHPQLLPELREADDEMHLAKLDELLGRKIAIAVGECGLDASSLPGAPLERQLRVLRGHFELARKHQLPLLVHCLRLHPAMRQLLREVKPPEAGLVLHSYSGGSDFAKFYAKQGCHFSFAGPVTFPEARKPLEALRAIPLELLLAETDAPDQAPHTHRGERSEPAYLPLIVDAMADARGTPRHELRERTRQNAEQLFRNGFSR